MSRLLISITDDDLPRNLAASQSLSVSSYLYLFSLFLVLCIASMPEFFQDIFFESSAVSGIGGVLILLAELGKVSPAIPVMLVVVTIVCPCVCMIYSHGTKVAVRVHVSKNPALDVSTTFDVTKPVAVEAMDVELPAKLDVPQAIASPAMVAVEWENLLGNDTDETPTAVVVQEAVSSVPAASPQANGFPSKRYRAAKEFSVNSLDRREPEASLSEYQNFRDFTANMGAFSALYPMSISGHNNRTWYQDPFDDLTPPHEGFHSIKEPGDAVSVLAHDSDNIKASPSTSVTSLRPMPNLSPVPLQVLSSRRGRSTQRSPSAQPRPTSPVVRVARRSGTRVAVRTRSSAGDKPAAASVFKPLYPEVIASTPSEPQVSDLTPSASPPRLPITPIHFTISINELIGLPLDD